MGSQSLEGLKSLQDAADHWKAFFSSCLSQRLEIKRFYGFAQLIYAKHPLPPVLLADIFLRPRQSNRYSPDPRTPPYTKTLHKLGYIDAPSILSVLYKYSSMHTLDKTGENKQSVSIATGAQLDRSGGKQHQEGKILYDEIVDCSKCWKDSSWVEEVMFYHVIRTMVEGIALKDDKTSLELATIICRWMSLFVAISDALSVDIMFGNRSDTLSRGEILNARAAFVPLLLRLADSQELLRIIYKASYKALRKELAESLGNFLQYLTPAPPFIDRLEIFRSQIMTDTVPGDGKNQAANTAMDELLDSAVDLDSFVIAEMPMANSRAALYILLSAALAGRPALDNTQFYAFLHNRYHGNSEDCVIDLIVASFDILANAVFRKEGIQNVNLIRSFVVNKLPLLLSQFCHPEFSVASAEYCITEALNRVDTSVFPTASLMFDESRNNNPYTESIREEFCAACALHDLIDRDHVDRILGEPSMSNNLSLEKTSPEKLVRDCLFDSSKIHSVISQLEKMDGNVGDVAVAIVEVIRQLCASRDTVFLKLLCAQLAQKPLSLDILLLFEKPPRILGPICSLLDNWRYEEDQGEYQPVYEEYGAILLLVFAFTYRYNLSLADIGIQSADSNVAKIIQRSHISRPLDQLTEQETRHMNSWINGFFDNETGGLGDELMSSCQPHEFYLLVAPIFQSIITAYTYGYINDESLKGGIEYVVDTFLLPSLVPAIRFLSDYLWVDQKEQRSIIKTLQLLLIPSSISGEASTMLLSVKNLIARPLVHALKCYQRQDPLNQDIEHLVQSLQENFALSERSGSAWPFEIGISVKQHSNGLSGAIRHTIQSLVQWSASPGTNSVPASYTHRRIIAGVHVMGTRKLLRLMMEEIRQQSEAGNGSIIYDVVAAIICADDCFKESPQSIANVMETSGNMLMPPLQQRGLRSALKLAADDFKKTRRQDAYMAEALVRLHRRVEAQMAMLMPSAVLQATEMALDLGSDGGGSMAVAAAATSAAPLAVGGLDIELGTALGSLSGTGGEGDIFGGMDMFQGWENMDLSGT